MNEEADGGRDAGKVVRIHIDREPYECLAHTNGLALYVLAGIPENRELFREVSGDAEDELINRSEHNVRLVEDEHFYSQRDYGIVVNARKRTVTSRILSFQNIVSLAFDAPPSGPNILFTIVYRKGPDRNPEGTLVEGQTVVIRDGMIFNVTTTDKS